MSKEKGERKDLRQQIKAGEKNLRDQIKSGQLNRRVRFPVDENHGTLDSKSAKKKPEARYNAVKHGGFSDLLFSTEEEIEEFDTQHQSLIEEYKPDGASEKDAVLTLAICYAHKRQIDSWYWDELTWLRRHSGYDLLDDLDWFLLVFGRATKLSEAHAYISSLPEPFLQLMLPEKEKVQHSDEKQEIQRLKECLELWITIRAHALQDEEDSVQFKAETGLLLRELTERKIAVEERIDSRIDKTIKRLALLKTLKQVVEIPAPKAAIEDHHGG